MIVWRSMQTRKTIPKCVQAKKSSSGAVCMSNPTLAVLGVGHSKMF